MSNVLRFTMIKVQIFMLMCDDVMILSGFVYSIIINSTSAGQLDILILVYIFNNSHSNIINTRLC